MSLHYGRSCGRCHRAAHPSDASWMVPPFSSSTRSSTSTTPFSSIISLAWLPLMAPPSWRRVFLALRHFESAVLASCNVCTSASNRWTRWANACIPFESWSTAAKIGVGELPWCLAIRPLIRVDCERASLVVVGVLETQGVGGPSRVLGGVGIRNLTSSFASTACGSWGISPDPRKPPRTFSLENVR
jgi:hypothetical protein